MANTITLKIQYKPNTPVYKTTIVMNKNSATIEEIASAIAEKCAEKLNSYSRGKLDKNALGRYKFGHYKLILQYLEVKTQERGVNL